MFTACLIVMVIALSVAIVTFAYLLAQFGVHLAARFRGQPANSLKLRKAEDVSMHPYRTPAAAPQLEMSSLSTLAGCYNLQAVWASAMAFLISFTIVAVLEWHRDDCQSSRLGYRSSRTVATLTDVRWRTQAWGEQSCMSGSKWEVRKFWHKDCDFDGQFHCPERNGCHYIYSLMEATYHIEVRTIHGEVFQTKFPFLTRDTKRAEQLDKNLEVGRRLIVTVSRGPEDSPHITHWSF